MSNCAAKVSDMRDGPHCNLPLSKGWKRAAERLADGNYDDAEVGDALCVALRDDWRSDGVPDFWPILLSILQRPGPDILPLAAQLDALRPQAHGHGTRSDLLELAYDSGEPPLRDEECVGIVRQVLFAAFDRHKNEILRHYRCEAPACAPIIEVRLAAQWLEHERFVNELAEELAAGHRKAVALPKRDGLDEGVPVCA